jgi:hypothetical protein
VDCEASDGDAGSAQFQEVAFFNHSPGYWRIGALYNPHESFYIPPYSFQQRFSVGEHP